MPVNVCVQNSGYCTALTEIQGAMKSVYIWSLSVDQYFVEVLYIYI